MRTFVLIALFIASLHARADALDDMVRAQMRWQRAPGLSLAVMKNGEVVTARAYGFANLETRTPARTDTLYKIGSLSKQFVAAGIMVLVQDGTLRLDEPVHAHLAGAPESWKNITIRMLLTHTSGIVREAPAFAPFKPQPDAEVITSAYTVPLRFEPGARFEYSNTGYYVLAEIIRKFAGEEWTSFIAKRVFAPAGLASSRPATMDIMPGRARGYETRAGVLQNAEEWLAVRPSGAYFSNVLDLAKWDAALYTDVPLTAASRAAMWTPGENAKTYGFGWFVDDVRGHRHVHHDGGVPGFVAQFHRFPDDGISVVILANIGRRDLADLAVQIAARYLPGLASPPETAIADGDPRLTSRLRSFLTALPSGTFDAALFTPQGASYVREDLARGFGETLREQGKLIAFELLERKQEGELRVRRYRVAYRHLTLFAVFKLDAQNRIAAWSLTD